MFKKRSISKKGLRTKTNDNEVNNIKFIYI